MIFRESVHRRNTMLEANQPISYIDATGQTISGYIVVSPKADSNGMITLSKPGGNEEIKVSPKRLVETTGQGDSMKVAEKEVAAKKPAAAKKDKPKVVSEKVFTRAMARTHEVWVKPGIKFDSKVEVKSVCVIIADKNRYVCFNTYNGTYGKKNTKPPIEAIENGENKGFAVSDIEKLRARLTKTGYKKEKAS